MLGVFAEREGGQGDAARIPTTAAAWSARKIEDVCVHRPSIACTQPASIRAERADYVAAKPQSDVLFVEDPPVREERISLAGLRVLVDAGIALSSELFEALLQRIVETAAEITGAEYAALGVIDKTGQALERFSTTGVGPDTHAAIGELPHGRGSSASLFAAWRRSGSTTLPTTPVPSASPRITCR